jgi:hypothetical protein
MASVARPEQANTSVKDFAFDAKRDAPFTPLVTIATISQTLAPCRPERKAANIRNKAQHSPACSGRLGGVTCRGPLPHGLLEQSGGPRLAPRHSASTARATGESPCPQDKPSSCPAIPRHLSACQQPCEQRGEPIRHQPCPSETGPRMAPHRAVRPRPECGSARQRSQWKVTSESRSTGAHGP